MSRTYLLRDLAISEPSRFSQGGSAAATAEKLAGENYRTTLKRRIAFANLRLAVFLPTVHVFHKEGVAVVRRGILRQNLGVSLA